MSHFNLKGSKTASNALVNNQINLIYKNKNNIFGPTCMIFPFVIVHLQISQEVVIRNQVHTSL
jgi:hypothetical protein